MATVGVLELTFRLEGCRSLKAKRQVLRSLIDRLRHRYEVSVAELEHQDVWDLTTIGVAVISANATLVRRMLDDLVDYADGSTDAELIEVHTELFGAGD